MRKSCFFLISWLIVFSFVFLYATEVSYAFWIWTPKSKKPINPKYAAKDTPEEQFKWAMYFFKRKEFQRAADEFVRLTDQYKDSDIAPEAQYYAGRSYEELGKYWFAYQNYQKTIDRYPYTKRLDEILGREYNIANIFQTQEAPKLMDLELNLALDKAIQIYEKIVENSAFGEYADKALARAAECYRRLRKYNRAVDTYQKLINDYPESDLVQEARYQLAYTMYEASLDPDYDQENTDEALEKFEKISKTTPVPAIAREAEKALNVLKSRKADSLLKVALFYEKRKKYVSALIYYKDIVSRFPGTDAAVQAGEKIACLGKKVDKK